MQEISDAPNDIGPNVDTLNDLSDSVGSVVDLSREREDWNGKSTGVFESEWNRLRKDGEKRR